MTCSGWPEGDGQTGQKGKAQPDEGSLSTHPVMNATPILGAGGDTGSTQTHLSEAQGLSPTPRSLH